jgi:hypothetical protein
MNRLPWNAIVKIVRCGNIGHLGNFFPAHGNAIGYKHILRLPT